MKSITSKYYIFSSVLISLGLSATMYATTIASEEFVYPTGNLNGQGPGAGFTGTWNASPTTSITVQSGSLANGVQNTPAGNKVQVSPSSHASILFSSSSVTTITSILPTGGLWGRYVQLVPSSGDFDVSLFLGSNTDSINIVKSGSANQYQAFIALNASSAVTSPTTPNTNDMVIFNVQLTNSITKQFQVQVWALDQTATSFDPTSSPLITYTNLYSSYTNGFAGIEFDQTPTGTGDLDEIYFGENPSDLNINVVPEPNTIISFLAGFGVLFRGHRKIKLSK